MWLRTTDRKVWQYWHGPRFSVAMHVIGDGRFIFCTVDGNFLDVTHPTKGPGVGQWIRDCWELHLESLTGHEWADYVEMGLIQEH